MSSARTFRLESFRRALGREAHNLARRPGLLWQQLHNRLQWEDDPVAAMLAGERERRSRAGSPPWMRLDTPLRESEELLATLTGRPDPVRSCAFSPDGSLIVSASDEETVTLWDARSGAAIRTVSATEGAPRASTVCAFSPDGRRIAAAGSFGILTLWDVTRGGELRSLDGHTDQIRSFAFSPDGSLIVSGSAEVELWDPDSGYSLSTAQDDTSVRGSRDDQSYAVCGAGSLRVWDVESGALLWTLEDSPSDAERRPIEVFKARRTETYFLDASEEEKRRRDRELASEYATRGVWACAFSPDARRIVSASTDGTLTIWHADPDPRAGTTWVEAARSCGSGNLDVRAARLERSHTAIVHGCTFSPDGRTLVSASTDGELKLWDIESGTEVRTLAGHSGAVRSCAYSPDGSLIVSAADDETIRLWDPDSGHEVRRLTGHGGAVRACSFSPEGERIVSASDDGTMKLWRADSAVRARSARPSSAGHTGPVRSCAFSPDGSLIASASDDTTVRLWDAESGSQVRAIEGHTAPVRSCAFSPDGMRICSASDRMLRVWDVESGDLVHAFESDAGQANACAFSPGGRDVACANQDGTLTLWDSGGDAAITLGAEMRSRQGYEHAVDSGALALRACAFGPDGSRVAAVRGDTSLQLWSVESGTVQYLESYTDLRAAAFSPDGLRIVSGGAALTLWEGNAELAPRPLGHHAGAVSACAFTPDGHRVVAADDSRVVAVWDLAGPGPVMSLSLPSPPTTVATHPWLPRLVAGDRAGAVYRIALVGVDYDPIVVNAVDFGERPLIRCPACGAEQALDSADLGSEIACQGAQCAIRLRVNPFVVSAASSRTSRPAPAERGPSIQQLLDQQDPYA